MSESDLKKIIEMANLAPSGGNSQPWMFQLKDGSLLVSVDPKKDHPILNFGNRGTYISFGALQYNIIEFAKSLGYRAVVEYTNPTNHLEINVQFEKNSEQKNELNSLAQFISLRCSNRKPFEKQALDAETKNILLKCCSKGESQNLLITIDKESINRLAYALSADVEVNLLNKDLHKLLFKEVLWKESDQYTQGGLYTKTMEMLFPQNYVFRMLSNWKIISALHKINLPAKIHNEVANKAAKAGAIGVITTGADSDINYINAGMLMQKVWLTATMLGFQMQLLAGVPFLHQQLAFGDDTIFSKYEKELLMKSYSELKDTFNTQKETIITAFRIGRADLPSARAIKRPPVLL